MLTQLWQRRTLGAAQALVVPTRGYDLTLLSAPDFDFVQDGTRHEDPRLRARMHEWLVEALAREGGPQVLVSGSRLQRLEVAVAAIQPLLRFAPLKEPA